MDSTDFNSLVNEYLGLKNKLTKNDVHTEIEAVYSVRGEYANIFILFDDKNTSEYQPKTPNKNNCYFYGRARFVEKEENIVMLYPGPNAVRNNNYRIDEKISKKDNSNLLGKELLPLPIYKKDIYSSNWNKRHNNAVFHVSFDDKVNALRLYSSNLNEKGYRLRYNKLQNIKKTCFRIEQSLLTDSYFNGNNFKSLYKYFKFLSEESESNNVKYLRKETVDSLDIIQSDDYKSGVRVTLDGTDINQYRRESNNQVSQIAYLEKNASMMKKNLIETSDLYKKELQSFRIEKENIKNFHRTSLVNPVDISKDTKCLHNEYPVEGVIHRKTKTKQVLLEYPSDYYLHENNYHGFRINAKTEEVIDESSIKKKLLTEMFGGKKSHLYRFKKRFTFVYVYKGEPLFNIDLTMTKSAYDTLKNSNAIIEKKFRPTPFIAFKQLNKSEERYELEIEYVGSHLSKLKNIEIAEKWKDIIHICKKGIYSYPTLFPNNHFLPDIIEKTSYDDKKTSLTNVLNSFHQTSCHIQHDMYSQLKYDKLTDIGPSVVSITKEKYNFMKTAPDDFSLMVKTDGYRCLGYIKNQQLFLFLRNMKVCLPFNIPKDNNINECIIDGEFWKGPNNISYYFIFDAYYMKKSLKSEGTNLMMERLYDRLDSIKSLHNVFGTNNNGDNILRMYIKTPLPLFKDEINFTSDEFKCIVEDNEPEKDGYIITHTGPIIEDLKDTEIDKLMGIMTKSDFENPQNTRNVSSVNTESIMFVKWKPKEQCTIDFQLDYNPEDSFDNKVEVVLKSKYNRNISYPLNLYTILENENENIFPSDVDKFVAYEPYEYELRAKNIASTLLPCTDKGLVITEKKELVLPGGIVEMEYVNKPNQLWRLLKHREDKKDPNRIDVALDNWYNLHHGDIPEPTKWENFIDENTSSEYKRYYRQKQVYDDTEISNFNKIHRRLMHYLISKTSMHYASKKIQVLDLGCGRGPDLVCWNNINNSHYHAKIGFYLGIEYDMENIMEQKDGTYSRYYNRYNCKTNYSYPALFLQGNCQNSFHENFIVNKDKESETEVDKVTESNLHTELYKYLMNTDYVNPYLQKNTIIGKYSGLFLQRFEIISIQMALHHLYESEHFWLNIKQSLHENGVVIATVPDGDKIKEMIGKNNGVYNIPEIHFTYKAHQSDSHKVIFSSSKINASEEPLFLKQEAIESAEKHDLDIKIIPFYKFVGESSLTTHNSPLNIYYNYGDDIKFDSFNRVKLFGDKDNIMSDYKRFIPNKDKVVLSNHSVMDIKTEKYIFPKKKVNTYSKEMHNVVLIKHKSNVSNVFDNIVHLSNMHKKGGYSNEEEMEHYDEEMEHDVEETGNDVEEMEHYDEEMEQNGNTANNKNMKSVNIPPLDLSFLERDFPEENHIRIIKK